MTRPRYRACLQEGLRLDLNRLRRLGYVRLNSSTGPLGIRWSYTYTDEEICSGLISAELRYPGHGWIRIQIGSLDQRIWLTSRPRHYGGVQWYFECPKTGRASSVVWMPPGARSFASRQAWRGQVGYSSQFQAPHDRALSQGQRLRCNLGGPDWAGYCGDDPPKPKWMRWKTYNRILERSYAYEAQADERLVWFASKLLA